MSDCPSKVIGYIFAEGYDTPEQAWEDSEGWVACVSHTHERILTEFAELVDEYLENHLEDPEVYRPKEILAWVLEQHPTSMDDLFEITEEMIGESDHKQCYECYVSWADDLQEQSMKDAVARWETTRERYA